jgi:hypothetical protein
LLPNRGAEVDESGTCNAAGGGADTRTDRSTGACADRACDRSDYRPGGGTSAGTSSDAITRLVTTARKSDKRSGCGQEQ